MKEAFLAGLLAMSANADNNDINIKQVVTPLSVGSESEQHTLLRQTYHYADFSLTADGTKAGKPHIVRHLLSPTGS